MSLVCPFCTGQSPIADPMATRVRCGQCHRVVLLPTGSRVGIVPGEAPGPHAVLLVRPQDPGWWQEAAWVRVLRKSTAGLAWPAVDQAWDAYAALRKPSVQATPRTGVHPLDGPVEGRCLLCNVVDPCPRCQPSPDLASRRRALYRAPPQTTAAELTAIALACGEIREAHYHASHLDSSSILPAVTALASGQPRRAVELAPAEGALAWVRARALIAAGKAADAVPILRRIDSPAARYLEACARAAAGDRDKARAMLIDLVSGSPALAWRARVSLAALEKRDPGELVAGRPTDPAATVLLARAFLRAGSLERAMEQLKADSSDPEVWLWRGHVLALARRPDDALKVYEHVVTMTPGHEEALVCLAHLGLRAGQLERVIKVEAPPGSGSPDLRFEYLQALCRLKAGQQVEGMTQLAKVARRTEDVAVRNTVATLHYQRGAALFAASRFREAIGTWRTAGGAEDPQVRLRIAEAYLRIGAGFLAKGEAAAAEEAFEGAVQLRGQPVDHYYAALAQLKAGKLVEGAARLEKAEADPHLAARARAHRALALLAGGKAEEAARLDLPEPAREDAVATIVTAWARTLVALSAHDHGGALTAVKALIDGSRVKELFPEAYKVVRRVRRRLMRRLDETPVDETLNTTDLGTGKSAAKMLDAVRAFDQGKLDDARFHLRAAAASPEPGEARSLLETLYGLWVLKLLSEDKVDEAARLCLEATQEQGLEGSWDRWRWAVLIDGGLRPRGWWTADRARSTVERLESLLKEASQSPLATQLLPALRHAIVVLSHKVAIELEEAGRTADAEPMWVRAVNGWLYLL
ncbi:MAG: hypothetical protein HY815_21710, partial [Candidatus Riflebacteria bacterium]|nr:hypothetical protein [Candidatus Riflebacteria bacterium]